MKGKISFLVLLLLSSATVASAAMVPDCQKNGQRLPLDVMNEQVLRWKSVPDFRDRAMIRGEVLRVTMDRDSHYHFEVQIGKRPTDTIEIVYNKEFGELPDLRAGMQVQACGDYITTEKRGGRVPTPSGAIIHWVHFNPGDRDGGKHEDGFVLVEGQLFGFDPPSTIRR